MVCSVRFILISERIKMKVESRISKIFERLSDLYPGAGCHLVYKEPHELLLSGILSAQTLDARVNSITPTLFRKYPSLVDLSKADIEFLEKLLKPVGMYKMKSRRLKDAASFIVKEFRGSIPEDMDELVKIPGVGRKTANLFIGEYLGKPAIIVDTHFIRVTARLGLVPEGLTPDEIEFELIKVIPAKIMTKFSFVIGDHGREICKARKPACGSCDISRYCCAVAQKLDCP